MADFSPDSAFERLKTGTAEVVKGYFPIKGAKQTLTIKNAWVEDDKHIDDIRTQKEARVHGRSWTVPVKAQLELTDNATGKVIDKKEMTIAQLPKITRRHSFIVDGNEWQVSNQFRLKSGVYTRIKENGDLEAQWNLKKGRGFRMAFDPESKKLNLVYGSANVPLYPVLKLLGVDDDSIQKRWGKDVLHENMKAPDERTMKQLYKSLIDDKAPPELAEIKKKLIERFEKTELRPDSTELTLGKPFNKVDGSALLHGAEKILKVSRREVEPDDRDGLQFKDFYSVEDLLRERIEHDSRRDITRKLGNKIDRHDKISDMLNPDIFGKPIKSFFTNSTITERPMQTNPMNFLGGARKTTIGGEHGLEDSEKITLEAKQIHPSHLGFLDAVTTPESAKIGTVLQMASGAKKIGKDIFTSAYNMKSGKLEWVSPGKALLSNVAFPDQYHWEGDKPHAIHDEVKVIDGRGQMSIIKPGQVDYVLRSSKGMFDIASNMIPFLQNDQGNRSMVASKQLEQAVPLLHREAPLVQTKGIGVNMTFERAVGRFNSHEAPAAGVIEHIANDHIIVKDSSGKKHEVQIYDNFPLNDNKAMLHSTPLVKVGDKVKAGQTIADTNFSRDGHLALGTNLRVAYIPYRGLNYDDGVVISESAAKKMTSIHLHHESISADESTILNKAKFLAETVGQVSKAQIDKLDDHGVIKPGSIVHPGDILIGALKKEEHTQEQKQLSIFSKRTMSPVAVRSHTWDKAIPGVVTQVVRQGKETTVYVKTEAPMEIGDKIAGRHGNKGVVVSILPDHEMPHTSDGLHTELLINPATVPSRINLGQILETAAGKLAKKLGKPYVVDNFDPKNPDYTKSVHEELKQHGISDKEMLIDPTTGKEMGDALVGDQYILKLHHTAEKGIVARSRGAYDINMSPKQGGARGGQTMDVSGLYALLAHGARENIREMQTTKSSMDDDYWTALQAGESVPPPKVPFAFKKFEGYLKAIGVNVVKDGNGMNLVPLTDKQILEMSNGELKHPDKLIRAKDLKPEAGGLFDPKITGTEFPHGKLGDRWSHFELHARMPNPVFEKPLATLLGAKVDDIGEIIAGKKKLQGKTGPTAISEALERIDVAAERKHLEGSLETMRKNDLSDATQKIKYLRALEKHGLKAHEAYTMQNLPVLPPIMRPLSVMDNGELNEADQNGLYKNIAETNHQLKTFDPLLPLEEQHELHEELYDGMKALMLTGSQYRGRHRRGILDTISRGKSVGPKGGYFQSKVIGRRQDLSMRGVIVPDPSLGLDEVAIPRKAAEEVYKPFLVQRLVRTGYTPLQAQQEVKKGTASAQAALEAEVLERPLLLKRDPVLHKYGVQAFKPILTTGNAIKIHPLVTGGFGADFDGDKMSAYAPLSQKAVQEAYKMLPSRNLFNPSDGKLMFAPSQESMLGLYKLSLFGKETKHHFKTASDAARAVHDGKLGMNDVVTIADPHNFVKEAAPRHSGPMRTTVGRILLQNALPLEARDDKMLTDSQFQMTKRSLGAMLSGIAKKHDGDTFARAADGLKDIGNEHVTGSSFGLEDLHAHTAVRESIFGPAREHEKRIRASTASKEKQDEAIIKLYTEASEQVQKKVKPLMEASNNKMYDWVRSGAKGNWDQFRQMVIAPVLVVDSKGKTIAAPITKSYAEGLDTGSYWASLYGARMGTIGRVEGTEIPGAQSKQMLQTTMNQLVVEDDCGTQKGIVFDSEDAAALDRYTSAAIHLGERGGKDKGNIPAGTLITPDVLARLKNNRVKSVPVRTPLKCQTPDGICATCFGLNENGHLHSKGENVGIMAVHALGEPLVQIAMRVFHEGGTAGSKGAMAIDRITRLRQLTELPKTLPSSATLSESTGKVERVERDASTGGWNVHVDGKKHFVPSRLEVLVKAGHDVKRGDALSSGPINPRELLPLKNISSVQNYLTNELQKVYESPSNLHRRNTEVFVRALTNLSMVTDPGDHHELMKGDSVSTSQIQAQNAKLPAGEHPAQFTPILKGTKMVPLEASTDWLARLQHQGLSRTIQDAAAEGWVSNIHGTHPIAGMAVGAHFGVGMPDAPWLY